MTNRDYEIYRASALQNLLEAQESACGEGAASLAVAVTRMLDLIDILEKRINDLNGRLQTQEIRNGVYG